MSAQFVSHAAGSKLRAQRNRAILEYQEKEVFRPRVGSVPGIGHKNR
ncbi:hypothetical protein GBF38_007719 [Nibea albiflora]|uniref:Uncharacterized protein n=1 Tax=Nibea albiflora TaxID=240163 RepID=A0ACB7EMD2_NIBAL|nr:hypothetical protein GBF38_007719 [Nibea albiflora]